MRLLLITCAILLSTGCSSRYVTPGGPAPVSALADGDIQSRMERKPASPFPARVALVRTQAPGYSSYRYGSYGEGNYSVVTAREANEDKQFPRIQRWPMVASLAPLSRQLLPAKLESFRELRLAAADLRADLLMTYTFDTRVRIDDHEIGPLGFITLGTIPNQEARITATASAMIVDVRTGFVYGLAEATANEKQMATVWSSNDAADEARVRAEAKALALLVDELEATWKGVLETHARTKAE